MKHNIQTARALTRKAKLRIFLRWLCYALVLLFLYSLMRSGAFSTWQPILIIPLSIAVAMYETEFSGAIFGAIAGLLLDLAAGNLFGFSAISLMPCCLLAGLLCMNLVKINFLNHLFFTSVTCAIMCAMDYFFNYLIWSRSNGNIAFFKYILPSYISAIILSPALYFLVKLIAVKLGKKEVFELNDSGESDEDDEDENKNEQ